MAFWTEIAFTKFQTTSVPWKSLCTHVKYHQSYMYIIPIHNYVQIYFNNKFFWNVLILYMCSTMAGVGMQQWEHHAHINWPLTSALAFPATLLCDTKADSRGWVWMAGVVVASGLDPVPAPARRTKLLQIPITVSLMGSWSTRKVNTGSYNTQHKANIKRESH